MKKLLFVIIIFFSFIKISLTSDSLRVNVPLIEINSFYKFITDEKQTYFKNTFYGFIVGKDSYIITRFSSLKGANYVFAKIPVTKDSFYIIRLYPPKNFFNIYYWQDEQRDVIAFKINDFNYNKGISLNISASNFKGLKTYFYSLAGETFTGFITQTLNMYKSSWLIMKSDYISYLNEGYPIFNENSECIGMTLITNPNLSIGYILSSEHIYNCIYQLSANYGKISFKIQIDDYIITPEIFDNLSPCNYEEVNSLVNNANN